jgi:putative transcriptional regulator
MVETSLQGRLLVAAPVLTDGNFARAVVLVLEHTAEGALGLVLNQPMALPVADVVAGWEPLAARPPVVFTGGPISPSAAICLAAPVAGSSSAGTGLAGSSPAGSSSAGSPPAGSSPAGSSPAGSSPAEAGRGWRPLLPHLGVLDLTEEPTTAFGVVERIRVFAGYAGWGAGQLEAEIAAQAWFVVDSRPQDVFSEQPERLWRDVLRRQPGQLAFVATYPPDPSLN